MLALWWLLGCNGVQGLVNVYCILILAIADQYKIFVLYQTVLYNGIVLYKVF